MNWIKKKFDTETMFKVLAKREEIKEIIVPYKKERKSSSLIKVKMQVPDEMIEEIRKILGDK